MTRDRVALVLVALAVLSVVATAVVAVATYLGDDDEVASAKSLVVTDPETGARFEVPGEHWEVRGPRSRIYYEDANGDPTAVVAGPAVYRDGYCAAHPGDSNRGFAGFTRESFESWRSSLADDPADEQRKPVVLAGGTPAMLRWVRLPAADGPCADAGVELAVVSSGDVQVVLVADTGAADSLAHEDIEAILTTLRPPR